MDELKTCMVTGHREINFDKIDFIKLELRQKILMSIEDGYTHFMSGFAKGVDLWFASVVAEFKEIYDIKLEAALPYRNRINTNDSEFKRLLERCDIVGVHSQKYTPSCFMDRNSFMVRVSSRVIVVYDGRSKGGTLATMRYAQNMDRDIHIINV